MTRRKLSKEDLISALCSDLETALTAWPKKTIFYVSCQVLLDLCDKYRKKPVVKK